jgi:hypothetical protein
MGFRLGEKHKKALRIGLKIGGAAGVVAGASLGAREAQRVGKKEALTGDLREFVAEGKTRGDIGIDTRPQLAGGGTQLAPIQGAVSDTQAKASATLKAGASVLEASGSGKLAMARAGLAGAKSIAGARGVRGDEAIQQQILTAGARAKAQASPAIRPQPQVRLDAQSRRILAQKEEAERRVAKGVRFGRRRR